MSTITLHTDDIDATASYYADTEGMTHEEKENVITTVVAYLARTTGHDIDWSPGWAPHYMTVNGRDHFTDDDPEYAVVEEINLAIETMVNAPWYDGPASLADHYPTPAGRRSIPIMIDADDLRDALIYGIQNAQNDCRESITFAKEHAAKGKLSPDDAHIQTVIAMAVDSALASILDKLQGDWPPSRY